MAGVLRAVTWQGQVLQAGVLSENRRHAALRKALLC